MLVGSEKECSTAVATEGTVVAKKFSYKGKACDKNKLDCLPQNNHFLSFDIMFVPIRSIIF